MQAASVMHSGFEANKVMKPSHSLGTCGVMLAVRDSAQKCSREAIVIMIVIIIYASCTVSVYTIRIISYCNIKLNLNNMSMCIQYAMQKKYCTV